MRKILETEEHVPIPPALYADPFYRISYLIKEEIRKYKWVEGGLFQGDIYSYSPKRPDPWIFGGDKLEGDWWVPAKPIGTSRPHRLIFRFRVINLQAGIDSAYRRR